MRIVNRLIIIVGVAIVCFVFPAIAAPKMFWVETTGYLRSANLDGTGISTLFSGLDGPLGIDADPEAAKIYWSEFTAQDIWRANINGSSSQLVHSNGTHLPLWVAVDTINDKVYWTDSNPGAYKIRRANLDGTSQAILINASIEPSGLAVDPANNRLYWTEGAGATGAIKRSALNGTGIATVYSTGASSAPMGLAIDVAGGKIYFADSGLDMIRSVNLDGTNPQNIITTGLVQPMDVALHDTKMYWTDPGAGANKIFRADKDGANLQTIYSAGTTDSPFALAILDNRPPSADIGGPYAINEGDTLMLDASASSDPDSDPITLAEWELNNDALFDEGAGITFSVNWSTLKALGWNDGAMPVSVRVSDGEDSDIASGVVTVNNLPPNLVTTGPYTINEGDDLFLDASATSDPGLDTLTFSWDINGDNTDDVFGATPAVPWVLIQAFGLADTAHVMRLSVFDGTVTAQVNVGLTIQNLPPDGQFDSYSVNENQTLNVAAPGVLINDTDPGGDALTVVGADSFSFFGATLSVSPNGALYYDPRFASALRALLEGEEAFDTFRYTVGDGAATFEVLAEVRVVGVADTGVSVPSGGVLLQSMIMLILVSLGAVYIGLKKKLPTA